MREVAAQVGLALLYYLGLVVMVRLAGKRLAGQTATFDLLVLISLGVVLQTAALRDGVANTFTFLVTVFCAHRALATASARWSKLRRLVRGAPTPLVENGRVSAQALDDESMSYDELLAGLRKLGCADPSEVKLAVLEETGHISVVPMRKKS